MECGLCGTANREGARFCGACGSPLPRQCRTCKAELDPGLRFCDQCGTPVDATEPAPAAPQTSRLGDLDAVRKTVTVLFADLGGSTGFGERTDPEVARQVLARYHALLQDAIDAHHGTVAKFMGDGMMATFGIPEIAEDDAERAVRAGVDIQARFERFAAEVAAQHGETLTARVGINTGEVVIGEGDADLVGDALNVAARLEKACRPGHVLVGDETWRLTRGVLAYESLGEVTVAGRAEPVGTYEVAASETRAAEPVAPFVGRDPELGRLLACFDRARTEHQAVLATVLGSPGLGKTRLSRELATRASRDGGATAYEIRCDRAGGSTFAPVADLVRAAAGLEDTESDTDGTETRARIAALLEGEADRDRVVDVLAGVLGVAPARSVEETFWAVRRILEALARDHPLLVVVDDIQWAEPKLLDLLEHLGEWLTDAPVLLVALARPELRELRPSLVETGRRVADVIALDGLDSGATEALAAGLLGSALPRELVDRLPASTDGNPLFVRELVRMLVDDRVIRRRDDGPWELAIDADAVDVPPTIQSLLSARVERLPADELRVLELASVVGAEFSVGALRELAGDDLPLPLLLERMRHKELVEPTGAYWGDEPIHRFHHVLIRDAAYRRLLKGTRADLHRRIGEWTDATSGPVIGEHETAIAFHYEQAHRYRTELGALDDETDRLGRRAATLLRVAAQRALDRDDLAAAGALVRRALAVLPAAEPGIRSELLLMACECQLASGDVAAGAPLVDELSELGTTDEQLGAWAACFRAQLVGLTAPEGLVDAEAAATAAAETLRALGDGAGEAKAHQVRALLLARLGRVGEAEAVLDLALGAARAVDDRRRVTAVLGAAPQAALFGPSPVARAGGRCLDVVRLLRITTASPSVEATSMRCQAVLEALRGRFDVSRSMLASARASLEELGLRHGLLETDLFTGMVELLADDPRAAVAPLRAAYEGLETLGVGADAGRAAALLATALLEQGEIDEAELTAAASEALAGQNLQTAIAWRTAKALVLAARGEVAAAVALARKAVDIAAATDLVLDHADACVVLADLRDQAGDTTGAREARADALRLYQAKGATVPAERLELATRSSDPTPEPSPEAGSRARSSSLENAATRLITAIQPILTGATDAALLALVADDYTEEGLRTRLARAEPGPDETGRAGTVRREAGSTFSPPEFLAVRGERLCLYRAAVRTAAGDESAILGIAELDGNGRLLRTIRFDGDDLDAALAELDERYLAGEGAADRSALEPALRFMRAYDAHDWPALRESLAPGFVSVDHRTIGFGTAGADEFVELCRVGLEDVPDYRQRCRSLRGRGRAVIGSFEGSGVAEDGGLFEWTIQFVVLIDADGKVARLEWFDEGDDAARRRLGELAAKPTTGPVLENAATGAALASTAALDRYLRTGERAPVGVEFANDFVMDDRRSIVAMPTQRRDDLRTVFDTMREQRYVGVTDTIIAVRGDRLCLAARQFATESVGQTTSLSMTELDVDGRLRRVCLFGTDQLDAAVSELDRSYLGGEGAAHETVMRANAEVVRLAREHDWDGHADLLADDFVLVDHRTVGLGTANRDGYVAFVREYATTIETLSTYSTAVMFAGPAMLTATLTAARTVDGTPWEYAMHAVLVADPDGRVRRLEWFEPHDWNAALARLHEIETPAATLRPTSPEVVHDDEAGITRALEDAEPAGPSGPTGPSARLADLDTTPATGPVLENAATRLQRALLALVTAGDRSGAGDVDMVAEDVVRTDRRSLVSAPPIEGAANFALDAVAFLETFDSVEPEVVAVRGERLALIRLHFGRAPEFVMPMLALYEFDEHGRLAWEADYDDDQLAEALAELDERYLAGEGAEHARVIGICLAFGEANERRDFDAMRAMLADDFVMDDRTSLGYGAGDRDYFDVSSRTRADVSPADGVSINRLVLIDGDALLTFAEGHHITPEGSDYSWVSNIVFQVGDDDLIHRAEYFDEADYTRAVARLHELGSPSRPWLENGATRRLAGSDASAEIVAIRGDRLALARVRSEDGPRFRTLATDPAGRIEAQVEHDDLATALADLDDRYIAGEGAEFADHVSAFRAGFRAMEQQDFDALRAMAAPEFAMVEHRVLGWPDLDIERFIEMQREYADVDSAFTAVNMRVGRGGGLATIENRAHDASGSAVLWSFHAVGAVDDQGRTTRLETFAEDDWDTACATFDRLRRPGVPVLENAASRIERAIGEQILAGELSPATELHAPEFRFEDHRSVVNFGTTDLAGLGRNLALMREQGYVIGTPEVVAIRGDRLSLSRWTARTGSGDESVLLAVIELDESERCSHLLFFDADDLANAVDELEVRHRDIRGDELTWMERIAAEGERSLNHRDFDAFTPLLAPEFTVVDHRPFGVTMDRDGYLENLRVLIEQAPDFTFFFSVLCIQGNVALTPVPFFGTTPEGNRYEWSYLQVATGRDGQATAFEFFDDDQADEAVARFAELVAQDTAPPGPPPLDNAATRLLRATAPLIWTDLEAALDRFSPDAAGAARESGPSRDLVATNRAMWEDVLSSFARTYDDVHFAPLALRGEHLALLRQEFLVDGYASPNLTVLAIDEHERIRIIETFGEDDLVPALERLDALHREDPTVPEVEHLTLASLRGMNRRDWDAFASILHDDLVVVDHQPFGFDPAGREEFVTGWMQGLVDLAPDAVVVPMRVLGRGRASLVELNTRGSTVDGNAYEWHTVVVGRFGAGDRLEFFPPDRWDDAVARLDEWAAAPAPLTPEIENPCTRTVGRDAIAVRGDRFALFPGHALVEVDTGGRIVREATFDDADVIGAFAALDTWHLEALGDAATPADRGFARAAVVVNRRDPAAYEQCLAPEVTVVDHLPLSFPPASSSSQFRRMLERLYELAPDTVFVTTKVYVAGRSSLAVQEQHSTTPRGNHHRWVRHTVHQYAPDARIMQVEYFPEDRWSDAVALLDEWSATPPAG